MDVFTSPDKQVIGFTSKLWVKLSNFKFIEVDVPIPTESLGIKSRFIISPSTKLCAVDTDTTVSFLCKVPVTLVWFASILYSKLLDPTFSLVGPKASPTEEVVRPTCVVIPI